MHNIRRWRNLRHLFRIILFGRRWLTAAPMSLITEADFVLSSVDVHHHIVWFLFFAAPQTWQETDF